MNAAVREVWRIERARSPHAGFDRRVAILVGLALLAFYLAIQRGEYASWDGRVMAGTARSIWEHGDLRTLGAGFPEHPGQPAWSVYGIGVSLLLTPLWGLQSRLDPNGAQWLTIMNPLLLATAGAVLYRIAVELGMRRSTAVGIAIVFGTLTMAPAYSTDVFAEPAVTLGTVVVLLGCIRWRSGWGSGPWLVGVGAGGSMLFRTDTTLLLGAAVLMVPMFVSWPRLKHTMRQWLPAISLPIGLAFSWLAYYNTLRYGSPLEDSYGGVKFTNPLFEGLQRQLSSPGKGFFWYDPILLAALPGLALLWRRDRAVSLTITALCALRVLLYAKWPFPDGSVAWGPRFLLPWCALLTIPLGECWEYVTRQRGPRRVAGRGTVVVLAALSAAVVIASVWVPWEQYWTDIGRDLTTVPPQRAEAVMDERIDDSYNTVSGSPLVVNLHELGQARPFPLRWFRGGPTTFGVTMLLLAVACGGYAAALAMGADRRKRAPIVHLRSLGQPDEIDQSNPARV